MFPDSETTVNPTANIVFEWLVFAEDWGRHPSSSQHIFSAILAQNETVYWVNSIGLRRPKLTDGKRIVEKLKQIIQPTTNTYNQENEETPQLVPDEVIAPIAISWPGNELVNTINRNLLSNQVNNKIVNENDHSKWRVLWLSLPTARCITNAFAQNCIVYYAGDDFAALAGVDHEAVTAEENKLVVQADLILAASTKIAAKFPAHKTHVINHGVDCDLFTQECEKPNDFPKGNFTVGYYGSITEWLDFELIEYLALQRKDINFVFIGRINTDKANTVFSLANVYHFADMPHHKLIEYASNWQVSLFPFLLNEQIIACDPLKLREYLAIGKPIIGTRFPALESFSDLAFIADDKEQGLAQLLMIEQLSMEEKQQLTCRSRHSIEDSTWQQRAEQVKTLITHTIEQKLQEEGVDYALS